MSDLTLRSVTLDELTPDPQNVRTHDQRNLDAIKNSLDAFGQRKPIVCARSNDGSLVVIAGNGTLEAARALGWTHLDVAEVPADWDADKARAYAIADNRTAELASWDDFGLANALVDLEAVGWDLETLGFEPSVENLDAEELDETDVEPPAAPFSVPGDVWLLGDKHKVVCASAADLTAYEKLLGDERVDLVWTDPPYGVEYVGKTKDALTIQNDDLQGDKLRDFLAETLGAAYTVTRDGAAWYVASPSGDLFYEFATVLKGLNVWRHTLVWVKDVFVMGRADYHYKHESIFYGWKEGAAHTWNGGRKQDTVLNIARPKRNDAHPTMKPIALIALCIENSTNSSDLVLDCFAGSGSTMLAALSTHRRSVSVELDPRYVDVICRRFQEATGIKPVNATTNEPHDFLA